MPGSKKMVLKYVDIVYSSTISVPAYPESTGSYSFSVASKLPLDICKKLTIENICCLNSFSFSSQYAPKDNYFIVNITSYDPSSGVFAFYLQSTYGCNVRNIPFRVYYIGEP